MLIGGQAATTAQHALHTAQTALPFQWGLNLEQEEGLAERGALSTMDDAVKHT